MSAQLSIFDFPPPDVDKARAEKRANLATVIDHGAICDTPAARNTDPDSSHAAARAVRLNGSRASIQQRALEIVQKLPGLTVVEIAVQLGLQSHTVGRRLSDLFQAERIKKGTEDRYVDGLPYTTWWPV